MATHSLTAPDYREGAHGDVHTVAVDSLAEAHALAATLNAGVYTTTTGGQRTDWESDGVSAPTCIGVEVSTLTTYRTTHRALCVRLVALYGVATATRMIEAGVSYEHARFDYPDRLELRAFVASLGQVPA